MQHRQPAENTFAATCHFLSGRSFYLYRRFLVMAGCVAAYVRRNKKKTKSSISLLFHDKLLVLSKKIK